MATKPVLLGLVAVLACFLLISPSTAAFAKRGEERQARSLFPASFLQLESSLAVHIKAFTDLLPADVKDKANLVKKATIQSARFEAAVGIGAGELDNGAAFAYADVLRRLIAFRLADPEVTGAAWKDAIGQLFQLPGASTDPGYKEDCFPAFAEFNVDRSGVFLASAVEKPRRRDAQGKLPFFNQSEPAEIAGGNPTDVDAALKPKVGKFPICAKGINKYNPATRDQILEAGLSDLQALLKDPRANIRELTHALSRATECGEARYENFRKKYTTDTKDLPESAFQKGCMRWMINKVDTDPTGKYATELKKLGFSEEHVKRQNKNNHDDKGFLKADPNLIKKGYLTPLTDSLCRTARPNGNVNERLNNVKQKVYRFKRGSKVELRLTKERLIGIGLPALSQREDAFIAKKLRNIQTGVLPDKETIGWGVGGNIWLINGDDDVNANEDAKTFLDNRMKQLMTVAAGPSGTTDEFMQMFDYCGLTYDDGAVKADPFYIQYGVLGAIANMDVYYHHSFFEIVLGAGCGYDGKNRIGRSFTYNPDHPFDWLNTLPQKPSTFALLTWTDAKTAPKVVIQAFSGAHERKFPNTLAAIKSAHLHLHTGSTTEAALLTSDYPDSYPPEENTFLTGTKGPHEWAQKHEPSVPIDVINSAMCTRQAQFPQHSLYRWLFCSPVQYVDWKKSFLERKGKRTNADDVITKNGFPANLFFGGQVSMIDIISPSRVEINFIDSVSVTIQSLKIYSNQLEPSYTAPTKVELSASDNDKNNTPVEPLTNQNGVFSPKSLPTFGVKKVKVGISTTGTPQIGLNGIEIDGTIVATPSKSPSSATSPSTPPPPPTSPSTPPSSPTSPSKPPPAPATSRA